MLQAVVVGNVWSTKRIDGLPSGAFLEVEVTGAGERLVAFDVLGSGQGERVLVAQGSVAAGWLPGRPPVDALIIGSIDEPAAPSAATPAGAGRKRPQEPAARSDAPPAGAGRKRPQEPAARSDAPPAGAGHRRRDRPTAPR
jgi:ethanolamine utilization protein EutN